MQKQISLLKLLPVIESVLQSGESYTFSPAGNSMRPLLYNTGCTVTLKKPEGRLRKYDMPLYLSHGALVLHRVIKVKKDSYVMQGDSALYREHGINDSQIIGVVCGFTKNGKKGSLSSPLYKIYCVVWTAFPFLRRFVIRFGKK